MTTTASNSKPVAVLTGASRGLGRALARVLAADGWQLIVDGRDAERLARLAEELPTAVVVRGDVTSLLHRVSLASTAQAFGRVDLLVNNASDLGPSPLPTLDGYPTDAFRQVLETNLVAPLALTQLLLPSLRDSGGTVLNISSDAAVEAYEGWGGYGSSKAALDQLTAVLAVEEPRLHVYAVDPGDMQTDMHQRAFPGEDISDRALPAESARALKQLLDTRPPSGRYRATEFAEVAA